MSAVSPSASCKIPNRLDSEVKVVPGSALTLHVGDSTAIDSDGRVHGAVARGAFALAHEAAERSARLSFDRSARPRQSSRGASFDRVAGGSDSYTASDWITK